MIVVDQYWRGFSNECACSHVYSSYNCFQSLQYGYAQLAIELRGAVRKRRPQSGGNLSNADILWKRGVLLLHFLVQKNCGFFEIYDVSEQTRGLSQCGHFWDKVVNFSRFCADVFYGWPLTTIALLTRVTVITSLIFSPIGPVYTWRTLTGVKLNNNWTQ